MKRRLPILSGVLLAVAVAGLLPGSAAATVMLRLDAQRLARRADEIVLAEVTTQRVLRMQGQLWTESALRVRRSYKGSAKPGAVLAVRRLGGELGNVGMRVAGVARFTRGEQTLVCLRKVGAYYVVVGMAQGKYSVFRDASGVWRAYRDLAGLAFAQLDARGRTVVVAPPSGASAKARELDAVVAELRRAALAAKRLLGGVR